MSKQNQQQQSQQVVEQPATLLEFNATEAVSQQPPTKNGTAGVQHVDINEAIKQMQQGLFALNTNINTVHQQYENLVKANNQGVEAVKALQDQAVTAVSEFTNLSKNVIDLRIPEQRAFLARLADAQGENMMASALREEKTMDPSFSAGFTRQMKRNVTVGHVVYTIGGVTLVVIGWEAVATKWDLPRLGLFDPADMKMKK
jgi:hypothetical protein